MTTADVFSELSSEQLRGIATRHELGRVLGVAPLGGSYGNNLGLTTETGEWVLRAAVPPMDPEALRRERFFARLISERSSIASPWPYLIDDSADRTGWPYALMPRLPGEVLHPQAEVPWDEVGAAFGSAVAELHRITFPDVGEWDADADDIRPLGITARERLRRRASDLAKAAALDDASSQLFGGVVDAGVEAIGDITPTYLHGDLGIANLVGETRPDGFRFTGVFDLGGGHVGDPDEDIAVPIWWPLYWGNATLSRSFLDGYRAIHPADPGQTARLRAYIAVSLLDNWETGHRLGHDWYGGIATYREWALPILDRASEVIDR
jgi:hygromycin-B 7''-O-kinase